MRVGSEVVCHIPGDGVPSDTGLIIGVMHYSDGDEVLCIATEQAHGMPVNRRWLRETGHHDLDAANRYRERYSKLYGEHWFKEIP